MAGGAQQVSFFGICTGGHHENYIPYSRSIEYLGGLYVCEIPDDLQFISQLFLLFFVFCLS